MRRFGIALFVLVCGVLPSLSWADDVGVRVSRHKEFGRIVFIWPSPVTHQLNSDGNVVDIRFGRPIAASFQRVRGALRDYVTDIELAPDGRGVQIRMTATYEAYSYDSGSSIILEIAKINPAASAESVIAPVQSASQRIDTSEQTVFAQAAKPAADLQRIGVRMGEHPEYTRLVFDWPANVDYTFNQAGGVITINFKRPASLNFGDILQSPPRFVGQIKSTGEGDGVRVVIAVAESSSAKHFLSGSKVVVDIGAPTGSASIAALPADRGAAEPAPGTAAPVAAVVPEVPEAPAAEPETAAIAAPPPAAPISAGAPPAPDEAAAAPGPEKGNDPGRPTALVAVNREPSRQAAQNPSADAVDAKFSGSAGVAGGGPTLRFDWDEPVAAAVFRRVGYLWIAFDKATNVDVAALELAGAGMIGSVQQVPSTSGTVLRMITPRDIHPSLAREGLSWLINFKKQDFEAKTPISINAQPDSPVGARVFIPIPEPGSPIGVTDPDVGDNLVIVPTIPLSHGVVEPYTFPEMLILTTMQGVVVIPVTDNLRVRPLRQGIELASSVPLSLSSVSPEVAAGSKLGVLGPVSRILDLGKWDVAEPEGFRKRKYELQGNIAKAKDEAAEQEARFNLARFYFAHAFAAEALGVLQTMHATRPEVEEEAEFRLIRGASSFLMNRLTEAAEDFSHPSLDNVDEGAFWRAAVIAKSGEVIGAAHELRRTGAVTQPYPKALRIVMATLIADSIVAIGDIKQAQQYLDSLRAANPSKNQLAEIDFIDGKLLEVGGDEEGAILKWEEVLQVDNRPTRFKATLAHMDILMKMDRMEAEEAIEALEGLRFVWRGGEEEFILLRKLGNLYLDQGNYRNGLLALRQAATYFRENENASAVTQQMSDTFNFLYLDSGADTMAPVTAIALYDEFKELTPAGRKGDEMIRNLADRLVRVDLLDKAAELLQQQIQFRLQGEEKAQVGLNLALIHALATEPEKVMAALDSSEVPNLSEELTSRRRHMRAESLIRMNRSEEALALLKDDKSLDADLIRSEMYWKQNDWNNAAQSLQKVVRLSGIKPGQNLSEEEAAKVLNLATAYTLSGNERALIRLRADFAGAMARTSVSDAFDLVAQPLSTGMIDPASMTSRVKTVTNFRTYLDKYKERLKKERLSNLARTGAIPKELAPGV
ncbi:MAG: tetratricopeptide repeat protein [Rhodospirillales bacterium]|nr:tetratricopeptide repeat protein [Rhodospirillales bacterium]